MHRRIIAALAAVLLAVVGVVLLTGYVSGADQRAMAGMKTTSVLVVTGPVEAGTPAEDLVKLVKPRELPRAAVAPGALTSLKQVSGRITAADLVAGEQLLAGRFAAPDAKLEGVDVPDGMHEVTIMLESQRVLGSRIVAGDTVGVFVTSQESRVTHLVLHQALVTRIEGGITPSGAEGDAEPKPDAEPGTSVVPEGSVVVTLALSAPDAELLVWGQEVGTVWLSREPVGTPKDGTRTVSEEVVFS